MSSTKRILIADYDFSLRNLLDTAFQLHGYHVTLTRTPQEAFYNMLNPERPAAIIVGDFEGGMSQTLDLVSDLRAIFKPEELPILVISANAFPHDRVNALAAGATVYMAKPFKRLAEVIDTVDSFLTAA